MSEETAYRYSKTLGTLLKERAEELDEWRKAGDKYKPVPTHLSELNNLIGGFPFKPFMMLLSAKEKIGKTTVAMDLADAWRKGGEKVMYVQLEELGYQFADRHFSTHTSLTKNDIRDLNITDEQIKELKEYAETVAGSGQDVLYIQDDLFVLEAIIQEAIRLGIKRMVIDNMSLFDLANLKGGTEREKLVNLVNLLVRYRNKEGFSFIVVAHEGADNKAYASSHLNKVADILIQIEFVYEENADEDSKKKPVKIDGLRRLHVLDSRPCAEGSCDVTFDGSKNKIGSIIPVGVDTPEFLALVSREGPPAQVVGLPLLGVGV